MIFEKSDIFFQKPSLTLRKIKIFWCGFLFTYSEFFLRFEWCYLEIQQSELEKTVPYPLLFWQKTYGFEHRLDWISWSYTIYQYKILYSSERFRQSCQVPQHVIHAWPLYFNREMDLCWLSNAAGHVWRAVLPDSLARTSQISAGPCTDIYTL